MKILHKSKNKHKLYNALRPKHLQARATLTSTTNLKIIRIHRSTSIKMMQRSEWCLKSNQMHLNLQIFKKY